MIGLCKAELIRRRGPGRTCQQVEIAILNYVDWCAVPVMGCTWMVSVGWVAGQPVHPEGQQLPDLGLGPLAADLELAVPIETSKLIT